MGFLRCRMDFSAPKGYGWTEHFYRLLGESDIDLAVTSTYKLALARAQMLGQGVTIDQVWASDEDVWRDSRVLPGPQPLKAGYYNPDFSELTSPKSDLPSHGFLARFECGPAGTYKSTRIQRGSPDRFQFFPGGPDLDDATFGKAWKNYVKALENLTFGLKMQRFDGAFVKVKFVSIQVAAGVMTVTQPLHGLNRGDKVRIGGVTGVGKVPQGIFTVVAVPAADTFTISNNWPAFVMETPGYSHKINYSIFPITNVVAMREATRRTGGPTVRPLGRRRRKRT